MRTAFLALAIFTGTSILSQEKSQGVFDTVKTYKNTDSSVLVEYNIEDQSFTFTGSTATPTEEETQDLQYVLKEVQGDFILTANLQLQDYNMRGAPERGLTISGAKSGDIPILRVGLGNEGKTFVRAEDGQNIKTEVAPKFKYEILQLERSGNKFIIRAAHFGEPLQEIGSHEIEMSNTILTGLFYSTDKTTKDTRAIFHNVRLDRTVPDNYNPGKSGYLGSRLETIDVRSGHRRIVHVENHRFEAPNWMPDGDKLLYNMDGLLYTIPVKGGEPSRLNTGFATNHNNDHGISFDGKMLAISHHREGFPGGGSTVYVLPLEGGEPKIVTEKTPSYWHGWAPNNREVVYVASREGNAGYNIYKKSIDGGEEMALTNTLKNEHVDGPEYSPDGKYIYYNGSASGTMQIWRMKPDGSQKEQITFDADNDWFPHISPDGKWIAYISFPPDIPVNDHPHYKRVTLKLLPADGGVPKVIAYLYGGQGTINVPSWSPDSKYFSFVSNF